MKKLILLKAALLSFAAHSANYEGEGTINTLRVLSQSMYGTDYDWLSVNGFSSAGGCSTYNGLAIMLIPNEDERAFSIALAAQMAGKKVRVATSDDPEYRGVGNRCKLRWINIVD